MCKYIMLEKIGNLFLMWKSKANPRSLSTSTPLQEKTTLQSLFEIFRQEFRKDQMGGRMEGQKVKNKGPKWMKSIVSKYIFVLVKIRQTTEDVSILLQIKGHL